jgi:hypothetical protein
MLEAGAAVFDVVGGFLQGIALSLHSIVDELICSWSS